MPVSHQADGGGLLDHVRALAIAAPRFGNDVTVAARPSRFLHELSDAGVDTLPCDLGQPGALMSHLDATGFAWDLIHAHPFEARRFGSLAAREFNVPLVVTMHGWYDDHIERWYDTATTVIAVSPAIAARLRATVPGAGEKIICVPNGIKAAAETLPPDLSTRLPHRICVASRIDVDFEPLARLILDFIEAAQAQHDSRWQFVVAGAGTRRTEFTRRVAAQIAAQPGPSIEFVGWLDEDRLRELYTKSFAAVAPGRSAVDAMASGLPTLMTRQIGTYSLLGQEPALGHFYGAPKAHASGYDLYRRLSALADEPAQWTTLSNRLRRATTLFYDENHWQQITNAIYEFALIGKSID